MSHRKNQAARVLERLQQGSATTWDIRPALGILCPTRRIFELRQEGHVIESSEKRAGGKRIVSYRLMGQSKLFQEVA
jgi:hypothetical protein